MTADEGFRPWAIRRYAFARLEWAAGGGLVHVQRRGVGGGALMECGRKMTVLILSDETVACVIMCVGRLDVCLRVCPSSNRFSHAFRKNLFSIAL